MTRPRFGALAKLGVHRLRVFTSFQIRRPFGSVAASDSEPEVFLIFCNIQGLNCGRKSFLLVSQIKSNIGNIRSMTT